MCVAHHSQHNHSTITAKSQRSHSAVTAQSHTARMCVAHHSQHNQSTIKAQSQHVTAQSQHSHSAITAQSQHSHSTVTAQSHTARMCVAHHSQECAVCVWSAVVVVVRRMPVCVRLFGCSTVVLVCFTCPAITVGTVILRALDRARERVLRLLCRSITLPGVPSMYVGVPSMGSTKHVSVPLGLLYGDAIPYHSSRTTHPCMTHP